MTDQTTTPADVLLAALNAELGSERAVKAGGIRDAAAYIDRMGRLIGSNESRLKLTGAPEFLRQLADAYEAGERELR